MGPWSVIEAVGPWADAYPADPMNDAPASKTIITTASSAGMMLLNSTLK
jgi:hypothetical protein